MQETKENVDKDWDALKKEIIKPEETEMKNMKFGNLKDGLIHFSL